MRSLAPAYIHCSTVKDPGATHFAPSGHSAVEIMVPIPVHGPTWGVADEHERGTDYRRHDDYLRLKEQVAEILIDRADDVIPRFKESVVFRELATPVTQERFTRTTEGSAYGIEFNLRQIGPMRPGVRTSIRGLFLCGASTSWGPGTEQALMSGRWAASAVLGRDLQREATAGACFVDPSRLSPTEDRWDALDLSRTLATTIGPARRHAVGDRV